MEDRDLGEALDRIETIPDKRMRLFGMRFSVSQLGLVVGILTSVVGSLYAGFLMYQKVEAVANLDLGEYQQAMDIMDAKVAGMSSKVEEAVEYSRDIKNGLRDDILGIEKQVDRVEDTVRNTEEKVRTLIDDAEVRFEAKREQLRTSQSADMKALEDRINDKLQRALDNPLAD
jgi:hypothetical protein|tara:strand:- start:1217 stop:1735 length:519 start_codon:yes stop_codon:yes gene_type:complete